MALIETRSVGAHAADRSHGGLLFGGLVALVLAVVIGLLIAWGTREHNAAEDARTHEAEAVEQRDAVNDALSVAEEQARDARAAAGEAETKLGVCRDVVSVSTHQRAALLAIRDGGTGQDQIQRVNRILNGGGYQTYEVLWDSCDPERQR